MKNSYHIARPVIFPDGFFILKYNEKWEGYTKEPKQNYWYLIPAELVEDGKFGKALLYGLIWSLTNKKGFCWASNKYFSKKLKRKDTSIISVYITELANDGWIKIENRQSRNRKIYPLINPKQPLEKTESSDKPLEKTNTTIGKNQREPLEKTKQSNIKSINKEYKNIYNHWNELKLKLNKEFTKDKIASIKKALKKYTYEEIKTGMNNYSAAMNDEKYFDKYIWSMENFLNREKGIDYFLNDGEKWLNYINWKKKQFKKDPDEILKKKREAEDKAQEKRDIEFKKRAKKVEESRSKTGGSLNLTEKINKKIDTKENNIDENIKTE